MRLKSLSSLIMRAERLQFPQYPVLGFVQRLPTKNNNSKVFLFLSNPDTMTVWSCYGHETVRPGFGWMAYDFHRFAAMWRHSPSLPSLLFYSVNKRGEKDRQANSEWSLNFWVFLNMKEKSKYVTKLLKIIMDFCIVATYAYHLGLSWICDLARMFLWYPWSWLSTLYVTFHSSIPCWVLVFLYSIIHSSEPKYLILLFNAPKEQSIFIFFQNWFTVLVTMSRSIIHCLPFSQYPAFTAVHYYW